MRKFVSKVLAMLAAISVTTSMALPVSAYVRGSVGTFRTGKWICENHSSENVQLYSTTGGRMENVSPGSGGTVTGMFHYNWDDGDIDENYTYAYYQFEMLSGPSQGYTCFFSHYNDGHIKVLHNFYHE